MIDPFSTSNDDEIREKKNERVVADGIIEKYCKYIYFNGNWLERLLLDRLFLELETGM